jgi:hypothetical protein
MVKLNHSCFLVKSLDAAINVGTISNILHLNRKLDAAINVTGMDGGTGVREQCSVEWLHSDPIEDPVTGGCLMDTVI